MARLNDLVDLAARFLVVEVVNFHLARAVVGKIPLTIHVPRISSSHPTPPLRWAELQALLPFSLHLPPQSSFARRPNIQGGAKHLKGC